MPQQGPPRSSLCSPGAHPGPGALWPCPSCSFLPPCCAQAMLPPGHSGDGWTLPHQLPSPSPRSVGFSKTSRLSTPSSPLCRATPSTGSRRPGRRCLGRCPRCQRPGQAGHTPGLLGPVESRACGPCWLRLGSLVTPEDPRGSHRLKGAPSQLSLAPFRPCCRESFRVFQKLSEIFSDDNNYSLSRELLIKVGAEASSGGLWGSRSPWGAGWVLWGQPGCARKDPGASRGSGCPASRPLSPTGT